MDTKFRSIVAEATDHAKLVAWDSCHKIYVALDDAEARWYVDHADRGYQCFVGTPDAMLEQVCQWYKQADADCGMQFIDATSTSQNSTETEHYSEFRSVIPQGAEARWDWTVQEEYWERRENG
jgi:hypothetical protein